MSELEARYRRLLRWYPRTHRATHEEEMLGVLLTRTEPGRRRPRLADSADLIRGAARIHLRNAFGPESASSWRSAFALAGLVSALVLACDLMALRLIGVAHGHRGDISAIIPLTLPMVIALILRAPRWLAAGSAWLWGTAYIAWYLPTQVFSFASGTDNPGTYMFDSGQPLPVILYLAPIALTALLVTLRPQRPTLPHRTIIGWSALLTVAAIAQTLPPFLTPFLSYEAETAFLMLPLTVLAVAAGYAARTPTGRRTILLAAVPVLLTVGNELLIRLMTGSRLFGSLGLLIPLMIMIWLARRETSDPEVAVHG
ncbi:hypothetical protein ABT352_18590 [Streptosporangium sp. NPDC000563]|uniref:hypothetical protein n=1 Tax=unclassified Streptosporangium TaxID=2632669 RepID=UPI00331AB111